MISIFFLAVCVVLAILGGAGFGFWLQRHLSNKRIGDANDLAQRIVEYREANGPFASVEGLLEVKGLGPGILEAIRPQITAEEEP